MNTGILIGACKMFAPQEKQVNVIISNFSLCLLKISDPITKITKNLIYIELFMSEKIGLNYTTRYIYIFSRI